MTRRLTVVCGRHTAWLHGRGLSPILQSRGIPKQWDHGLGVWMIPVGRTDDLLAAIEDSPRRWTVTILRDADVRRSA